MANLQHVYAPNFVIFHEKSAKNGRFLVKIESFGLRKAVEDPPPPILRVLDANKQVREADRPRNIDHPNTIYSMLST